MAGGTGQEIRRRGRADRPEHRRTSSSRIIATGAEYEKTSDQFAHGIRSTPTLIVNNRMIIGTLPYRPAQGHLRVARGRRGQDRRQALPGELGRIPAEKEIDRADSQTRKWNSDPRTDSAEVRSFLRCIDNS